MRSNARIMISGAGVAGLTAALWLGRAGFRPVVVERAPRIRADGYLISLSHHSYRLADELGLLPRLRERQNTIERSNYRDRGGRAILSLDYRALFRGVDILQIMRDDLQEVLYDEARELAEFRLGISAEHIEQDTDEVRVRFSDGSEDRFDAVIGADGLHSAVRRLCFDAEEVIGHEFGLFCAAYRLDNVIDLDRSFDAYLDNYRHTAVYTTREGDLATVFVWQREVREPPPPAERLQTLRDVFRGSHRNVWALLEHCPPQANIYMDRLLQIDMPSWHKGRVAVVGDAAHCLTLLSGQGASVAFASASVMARSLIEHEPATAFTEHARRMRPVVHAIQPRTRESARLYVPRGLARYLARDAAMRFLPNAFFQRYFRKKYTMA